MRDPDLVHRAERAASALERAWDRWRTMHGLGTDPLPPVSSYVGYSVTEPWGQPRVVFGVDAEEAERLADLLDGHECVGPVYAEVAGRPDWLRKSVGEVGLSRSLEEHVTIPAQAPPPAADMLTPHPSAHRAPEPDVHAIEEDATGLTAEPADEPIGTAGTDAMAISYAPPETGDQPEPDQQTAPASQLPELAGEELVPLPPMPDPAPSGPMGSASLTPAAERSAGAKSANGSTQHGPRYQGSPARYKATTERRAKPVAKAAAADTSSAAAPDTSSPAAPDTSNAAAPDPRNPAAPDAGNGSAPDTSTPAAPDTSSPAAPEAGNAAGPEAGNAAAPVATNAAESEASNRAGPDASNAAAPEASDAAASDSRNAAAPGTSNTAESESAEPATPVTKSARARSRQGSKQNRARQQGSAVGEAWELAGQPSAADRAV